MASKPGIFPTNMAGISHVSAEFWRENVQGGWATIAVLLFLLAWRFLKAFAKRFRPVAGDGNASTVVPSNANTGIRISEIISDADLRNLINNLEGKLDERERWEDVIEKRNNHMSYEARCCKPKDAPLKYRSLTTFENCSTELLRDFYMDNEYRKEWDKTLVEHKQFQVDDINGTEIGCTIKKFPLLTPREYVLAWRIWEGKEKTFYCFIRECEHALAPQQKKYVRVGFFRSGWRIRKVPGRDACEIAMVHQEDAGLNVELAKLAFAKGIWSYVCKMDNALRKYPPARRIGTDLSVTALQLIQKVPPELEARTATGQDIPSSSSTTESREKKFLRKPSKKWIANGLLLLGGVVCLSRGHSSLGAKLAMACILKKLTKHGASSSHAELSRAQQ